MTSGEAVLEKNVIDSDVKWLLQYDHNAEFCSLSCTWEGTIKRAVAKLGDVD